MSRTNVRRYRRSVLGGHTRWYYLVCGVLTSFVFTIPVFLILSLAVSLTDFPEQFIPPAVFATMILSVVASAFMATAGSKTAAGLTARLLV